MQKIKQKQRDKIYNEFEKEIPLFIHKWKSSAEINQDINSYTETIKKKLKEVLDKN